MIRRMYIKLQLSQNAMWVNFRCKLSLEIYGAGITFNRSKAAFSKDSRWLGWAT